MDASMGRMGKICRVSNIMLQVLADVTAQKESWGKGARCAWVATLSLLLLALLLITVRLRLVSHGDVKA